MLWVIALHSSTHTNLRKCGNNFVN